MNKNTDQNSLAEAAGPSLRFILAIYYPLLVVMLVASFFPHWRVWGVDHWAHYPVGIAIVIFCLGIALPFILRLKGGGREELSSAPEALADKGFVISIVVLMAIYLAAFYFLRARTHYLGDGYQLLANLPAVNPWIKLRNLGEELIHKAVFSLLSGEAPDRSLRSFQLVSFASGFVFLLSVAVAAKNLFTTRRDRLLFFVGAATGGYMLLYFGYVENYSVFVTFVLIYALTGLMIIRGRVKRWYILIPMILAGLMHTLGFTLVLPSIYLLTVDTRAGAWLSERSFRVKILLSLIPVIMFVVVFRYLYTQVFFFRFSLVPFSVNTFAIEGYTLFSLSHLLDIVNLCFVLLPSFPIFIALAFWLPFKESPIRREIIFLSTMTLSTLAAAVIFDPKLGMPRDWDLFSFCGIPAGVLGYYALIKSRLPSPGYTRVASLAVFLGLAVLVPRAVGRALGSIEVAHVENYIRLDVRKNKNINFILRDYHTERGDPERAAALYEQWKKDFPERGLNERGLELRNQGKYAEAAQCFLGAIGYNPTHVPTYAALASCYRRMGEFDEALVVLGVANGMDPNNVNVLSEFAYVHRHRGDLEAAERYFREVLSVDPSHLYASLGLLEVLWSSAQHTKHDELLIRVARLPDAPPAIHLRLGSRYFSDGLYDEAESQFRTALGKGADSVAVQRVLDSLSRLKQ